MNLSLPSNLRPHEICGLSKWISRLNVSPMVASNVLAGTCHIFNCRICLSVSFKVATANFKDFLELKYWDSSHAPSLLAPPTLLPHLPHSPVSHWFVIPVGTSIPYPAKLSGLQQLPLCSAVNISYCNRVGDEEMSALDLNLWPWLLSMFGVSFLGSLSSVKALRSPWLGSGSKSLVLTGLSYETILCLHSSVHSTWSQG